MFKNQTINTILVWAMTLMSLFVILFIFLVIYEEYNDFEREASNLRREYIQKQKQNIKYDVNRVVSFIQHSYKEKYIDKSIIKKQTIDAIEYLYGRPDGTGYIFIYDFNGTNLCDIFQPNIKGQNLI